MAKILSFLSWNVENFHGDGSRVDRVVQKVADKNPDVFALYEVKGSVVFNAMVSKMPGYTVTVTESPSVPEILVGVKGNLTSFVTQRDELQSKVPSLRPGALATITKNGENYSLLFLHLKSFPNPRDWGLRDDMFGHITSLKRKLDKNLPAGQDANFVAIGDVNTMGLKAAYNNVSDMTALDELAFIDNRMTANANRMRRLTKTHNNTWWNGKASPGASPLDHAYASDHLNFKKFGGQEIEVTGWVDEATDAQKKNWISRFSDHSMLYGEIHD